MTHRKPLAHIAICHPYPCIPDRTWPEPESWAHVRADRLWISRDKGLAITQQKINHVEIAPIYRWPNEMPRLVTFDMDSTLIQQEVIDEVARMAGCYDEVAAITERAMRGEVNFKESLEARVSCLRGLDAKFLDTMVDRIKLSPGAESLVRVLNQCGVKTAIISGGFDFVAQPMARRLQMDAVVCHRLEIQGGKLTGRVQGAIVDAEGKAAALKQLAERWQIPLTQTMSIGDGANDLQIMKTSAMGIAWHAKPTVARQADLAIHQLDLDAICWLYETWAEKWLNMFGTH